MISTWVLADALRSEHLVYRAIESKPGDIDFLSTLMLDPTVQAFAGRHILRPLSQKKTEDMISRIYTNSLVSAIILLAPKTKDGAEQEGDGHTQKEVVPIGYLNIGGDLVPEHMHLRDTEIGILLKEEYRGKGYGTEAINWGIDWSFRNANMRRVSISCYEQNTGAEKLYKRLGFVEEGRRRKKMYHNMQWYDEVLLGLLREEWLALRRVKADERDI